MQTKNTLINVLLSGVLFTVLFHNQTPGLNLLIFEFALIGWLFISDQLKFRSINSKIILAAQLLTCTFTIISYSVFGYIIHVLISLIFIGMLIYPSAKSHLTSLWLAFANVITSQVEFYKGVIAVKVRNKRAVQLIWESRLFLIPMIVVSIFISIYNKSNPKFDELTSYASTGIFDIMTLLFEKFDLTLLWTLLAGILISNLIFFRSPATAIVLKDLKSSDFLSSNRFKIFNTYKKVKVKNEIKSAMFLLVALNFILLVVNIIDIKWVWFGFEWEGQYLKQFVHEGTYLLIISILISISIVLYFYRGAINYINYKHLKYLSYLWLMQNLILAISVGIRNYYYIEHFNLAYKRIGVIIFLALTIYGLISVLIKVHHKYSAFYLFRKNFLVMLLVLSVSSMVNWDNMIARYNFNNSEHAFIHYNFLASLSDKTLPLLDKNIEELNEIKRYQTDKFPNEPYYMTATEFHACIQNRKSAFRKKWESKGLLSWNLPEQLAYNKLSKSEE